MRLHLDFETRCALDLKKVGVDRYARNAEVLMLAWAFNDDEPRLWLPEHGDISQQPFYQALTDPSIIKVAWNKRFEQLVFRHAFNLVVPNEQWLDPSILARSGTLPSNLDACAKYLGLAKDEVGKQLVGKNLEKSRGGFSRLYKGKFKAPADHPDDWLLFQSYCKQDVRAEREVLHKIEKLFPLTAFEKRVEQIDADINERGMPVDMQFVREASKLVEEEKTALKARIRELTGVENPNSKPQMLEWLQRHEYPFSSLGKNKIAAALKNDQWMVWQNTREVLELHQKLSRSSTSKLDALLLRTGPDDVLRHSYKYLGADRTGRWSGEGFQPQNLPR